jgi:hypothetical protein
MKTLLPSTGVACLAAWLLACSPTAGPGDDSEPDADTDADSDTDSDTDTDADCASTPTFEDGAAPTAFLHVAPGGDDSRGDGSEENPYATIERAAAEATPGTAVVVHAGTYPGDNWIEGLAGTAQAPIWIGGAEGEARPVISGGGEGLHLSRVSYAVVHDLEVTGAAYNGINCDDGGDYADPTAAHHVVFRDLFLHDIGAGGNEDCLKLSGLNDYFVLDSEIASCGGGGSGSGVDHVGCHRGLLARNFLHDLSANAVQCKGGSEDIEIRWNVMRNAGERAVNMGGSTGFEYFRPPLSSTEPNFEARDIRVVSNVIVGAVASFAFVGCVGCAAVNNTIVDPENWILRILQETVTSGEYEFLPCADNLVQNNLVTFAIGDLSTWVNVGPDVAAETFTFTTNLWYAHDDPTASAPDLPVAETGAIAGQDPLLDGEYAIPSESPAWHAGTPWTGLVGDLRGACYADPPSIGAFEWIGD